MNQPSSASSRVAAVTASSEVAGTRDWEAAHRAVADVYFPHDLTPLDHRDEVDLSLSTVEFGGVTIGKMTWGTAVSIACDYPGAYEVNIPLSGQLRSRSGTDEIVATPGQGIIFHADQHSLITEWSADCHVVGVKFTVEELEREADRLHLTPVRNRLKLPEQIDVSSADGSSWLQLVNALSARSQEPVDLLSNPLVGSQLASAVVSAFLLAAAPDSVDGKRMMRPGMVKRVLDAIDEDPGRPWTVVEMAAVAGSSVRRLQEAFAEYVGTSPTRALADIRLSKARVDVENGVSTVAEIASRWGFSSPSRFASAFRNRYGVAPSQVLRR